MAKYIKGILKQHPLLIQYFRGASSQNRESTLAVTARWGYVFVIAITGLVGFSLGFGMIEDSMESLLTLLFEFAEENLELMYRKSFGLNLRHAQMATAYTGLIFIAGLGYVSIRRFSSVLKDMREVWLVEREKAEELWAGVVKSLKCRWESLDFFNKCFMSIAAVVLAIPLIYIFCIAVGNVIAELV